MYQAALGGNWKAAQKIIDKQKNIVAKGITRRSDNSLHIAVAANQTAFVENLLKKMERHEMESTNDENNTALHIAAALGAVKIAKMLVKANKKLHNIRGGKREILPIHLAALFRQGEMVRCLFGETKTFNDLDEREFLNLFQAIIEADIYGKYIISRLHCFPSISVKLVIFSINRIRRCCFVDAQKRKMENRSKPP